LLNKKGRGALQRGNHLFVRESDEKCLSRKAKKKKRTRSARKAKRGKFTRGQRKKAGVRYGPDGPKMDKGRTNQQSEKA